MGGEGAQCCYFWVQVPEPGVLTWALSASWPAVKEVSPWCPVGCLLIKTPADHWSWWIFSIISCHWWLAVGLTTHDQGPCAHDVVTTCSARARAPAADIWQCTLVPVTRPVRPVLPSPPLELAPCSERSQRWWLGEPAWALSWAPTGPQSRFWQGLGNLTATLPTIQNGKILAKMNQFDSWWLVSDSVTLFQQIIYCANICEHQPKVASEENIKLKRKVLRG